MIALKRAVAGSREGDTALTNKFKVQQCGMTADGTRMHPFAKVVLFKINEEKSKRHHPWSEISERGDRSSP